MDRSPCLLIAITSLLSLMGFMAPATAQTLHPPPRDPGAPVAAGGTIRGRVVAAIGGQPLHRVRVTLNGLAQNPPTSVTNIRGEFELTNIPSGAYTLTATRAGYLTIQYGQRGPREAGRPIHLRTGQVLEGLEVALYKGGVIAGRVADEQGDPAPGARVEAVELRYLNGRRVPVAAGIATSNDIGEFRLPNLSPGAYQLRASTMDAWESDDFKTTFVHAETYYPGVKAADGPTSITVQAGREVADVELRLIAGRAAQVTGLVEDGAGAPLPQQEVHLSRILRTIGGNLLASGYGVTVRTDAQGRFSIGQLAPGEFTLYAGGPSAAATARLFLGDGDVRHVVLSPRHRTQLTGSVVIDGDARPPFPPARLRILPLDVAADGPLAAWGAASETSVGGDWKFRLANIQGTFLFRVRHLPDDWMVKRVLLAGQDLTDTALPVPAGAADIDGLQIVISPAGAKLTGTVITRDEAPMPDVTVIVFTETRGLWGPGSRFVKAVRPDSSGTFVAAGLPAGAYRVIARDVVADGQWEDTDFLTGLLRDAQRVELPDGGTGQVALVVEGRR